MSSPRCSPLYWLLVLDGRPRYWLYLGITLGIGLEVKYTIIGLIAGTGLLCSWSRR
jgi:hypothetical protein